MSTDQTHEILEALWRIAAALEAMLARGGSGV